MKTHYRSIIESDLPSLFAIRVATRENTLSYEDLDRLGITEGSVLKMLRTSHFGWLCEVEDRPAGFAMGNRETGEMWVIAVLPEYENMGIGAELLRLVEKDLRSSGWRNLWLTTDIDPALRAYGFYQKQGWSDREIKDGMRYMQKSV
jgi:ribosomal protein S18 acetylase RimI-like enzyme